MDMRRNYTIIVILFIMTIMLPATVAAATIAGYQFVLHHDVICAGAATVVYGVLSMTLLKSNEKRYCKIFLLLISCLPLLSAVNLLFYMWESGSISVTCLSAIWIVLSVMLVIKILKSRVLKIALTVTLLALLIPIGFTVLTYFTIGQIGRDIVVSTVASPGGTHRAEVIASSQGALGGDTVVQVYNEHDCLDLYFCEFQKVQCVYIGEWDKHYDMDIYWKSEQELMINGNTCEIE